MVSGTLVDTLLSPSLALNDLFSQAAAEGRTDDFPAIVREHFSSLFSGDALDQVGTRRDARRCPIESRRTLTNIRSVGAHS